MQEPGLCSCLQVKTRSSTQCDILKNELCSEEKKVRITRNDFWSVFGENWMFLDIGGHQTLERDWRNHLVEKLFIDNEGHHCLEALNQITDFTVHKGYWPGIQPCKCTKCGKAYRGCSFQNQQRSLPGYRHYPCEECGEACSCVSCLSPPRGTDIVEEPNKCQDAGRTCKRCVKSHGSKWSSDCKKSGKALAFPSSFKGHERGQHGQKTHMCKVCGESFTYHPYLARHLRTHTGEKHCECEDCEQALQYSSSLVGHMMIHTTDKPYVCKKCGKSFSCPKYFRRHMKTHSGMKPYECTECGKAYSSSLSLREHAGTPSQEKPYECQHCGKAFKHQRYFKKHVRMHSGAKPTAAPCPSGNMREHTRGRSPLDVHSEEKPTCVKPPFVNT